MDQYKDNFLDNDRKRMRDELDRAREHFDRMESDGFPGESFGPERSARKRKRVNPLAKLKDINWNPNDKSLTAHFKDYRADTPPDEE